MIGEAVPSARIDTPVVLTIDGLATSLNGVFSRCGPDTTLIKFKLTEVVEKLVGDLISGQRAA